MAEGLEFEVEKLIDYLPGDSKKKGLFLVRWAGYTSADDTWEPEKNLAHCTEKIAEFWNSRNAAGTDLNATDAANPKPSIPGLAQRSKKAHRKSTYVIVDSDDENFDTRKDKFWKDVEDSGVAPIDLNSDIFSRVKEVGRAKRPTNLVDDYPKLKPIEVPPKIKKKRRLSSETRDVKKKSKKRHLSKDSNEPSTTSNYADVISTVSQSSSINTNDDCSNPPPALSCSFSTYNGDSDNLPDLDIVKEERLAPVTLESFSETSLQSFAGQISNAASSVDVVKKKKKARKSAKGELSNKAAHQSAFDNGSSGTVEHSSAPAFCVKVEKVGDAAMVGEFHTSEDAMVKVESDEQVKKKKKKHKNKDEKDRSSKKKASKAAHSSSSAVKPITDVDNVFDGDTLPKVEKSPTHLPLQLSEAVETDCIATASGSQVDVGEPVEYGDNSQRNVNSHIIRSSDRHGSMTEEQRDEFCEKNFELWCNKSANAGQDSVVTAMESEQSAADSTANESAVSSEANGTVEATSLRRRGDEMAKDSTDVESLFPAPHLRLPVVPRRPPTDITNFSNSDIAKVVKANDWDALKRVLSTGKKFNLEQTNDDNITLLMTASQLGYHLIVHTLARHGASIHTTSRTHHMNALMMAAEKGHLLVVQLLLAMGSKMNVENSQRETALLLAIKNHHHDVVRTLLNNGCNFSSVHSVSVTKPSPNPLLYIINAHDQPMKDFFLKHFQRVDDEFMRTVRMTVNGVCELQETLFPLQCLYLREATSFRISFSHDLQPTKKGVGMILFIGVAMVTKEEVRCRFFGHNATTCALLNGHKLKNMTEAGNYVMTFVPLANGENVLEIQTIKVLSTQPRLLVCAYRAHLTGQSAPLI